MWQIKWLTSSKIRWNMLFRTLNESKNVKKTNIWWVKCLNKNNLQYKKYLNVCHKTGTWDKKTQDVWELEKRKTWGDEGMLDT